MRKALLDADLLSEVLKGKNETIRASAAISVSMAMTSRAPRPVGTERRQTRVGACGSASTRGIRLRYATTSAPALPSNLGESLFSAYTPSHGPAPTLLDGHDA